ncbi:MAG: hypothetical protein NUV69_03875, partial [Candidatus Curtissbacteria bacterium]|nr:hypothetical protein [Candidatus Curtissbacteria bacterium]
VRRGPQAFAYSSEVDPSIPLRVDTEFTECVENYIPFYFGFRTSDFKFINAASSALDLRVFFGIIKLCLGL